MNDDTLSFKEDFDKSSNVNTTEILEYVQVKLLRNAVEVHVSNSVKKLLEYSDFISMLSKLAEVSDSGGAVTGMLPPSNLIFISTGGTEVRLNCYYTGGIKPLMYNKETVNIVVPNIIISHILKIQSAGDMIVAGTKYFCTDLPVFRLPRTFIDAIDHKNNIFLLPMSNTYSDARMCYGDNRMPSRFKDNNIRGLDYYYKYLWETPFNDDLGISAINHGGNNVKSWYGKLALHAKEGKPFPYEDLRGFTKETTEIIETTLL